MFRNQNDLYRIFLELAFEISELITSTKNRDSMYKEIIGKICEKLDFDYAEVWKKNKEDKLVKADIMVVRNDSVEGFAEVSQRFTFAFDEGIPGITWRSRQPIWIANVQDESNFIRRLEAKEYNLKTGVTMPIFAFDYLDAVCFFFSKHELEKDSMFLDLLNHFARIIGMHIIKDELEREVQDILRKSEDESKINIKTINKIFALRDPYTILHQDEVANFSKVLGQQLHLDEFALLDLYLGGLLHDIGKIETPQEILSKPSSLNNEEYNLVRRHPNTGYGILLDSSVPPNVKTIVLEHHERNDGSGYPNNLHEDEINYLSKIVAVSDLTCAMRSHRPYRAALPLQVVTNELKKQAGITLDKEIANLAIDVLSHAE